jgi:hypothetical protein
VHHDEDIYVRRADPEPKPEQASLSPTGLLSLSPPFNTPLGSQVTETWKEALKEAEVNLEAQREWYLAHSNDTRTFPSIPLVHAWAT